MKGGLTVNTLFLVTLIVESLFALGFIFAPGTMLGNFGVTLDTTSTILARMFGSALVGFPILLWFARKSDNMEFKKGAARSLFAYYLVSTVPLVIAETTGLMNALGWSVVGLHGIFLLWFGYFLVK